MAFNMSTAFVAMDHLRIAGICCITCGNLLIILANLCILVALLVDKKLSRTIPRYFIASLCSADLGVGVFVTPFFIRTLALGEWGYGPNACRTWVTLDIFLCTASIYNVMAIGFDRYMAITLPLTYKAVMTPRKALVIIVTVWTSAAAIAAPALFLPLELLQNTNTTTAPNGTNGAHLPSSETTCSCRLYKKEYIAFALTGSFYFPISALLFLYANIYRILRRMRLNESMGRVDLPSNASFASNVTREKIMLQKSNSDMRPRLLTPVLLRIHKGRYHERVSVRGKRGAWSPSQTSPKVSVDQKCPVPKLSIATASTTITVPGSRMGPRRSISDITPVFRRAREESVDSSCSINSAPVGRRGSPRIDHDFWLRLAITRKRLSSQILDSVGSGRKLVIMKKVSFELRALKTFAVIACSFIACWSGFCLLCTLHMIGRFGNNIEKPIVNERYFSFFIALGYANSALNPLIYGMWNSHFRIAFRHIRRVCRVLWKRV